MVKTAVTVAALLVLFFATSHGAKNDVCKTFPELALGVTDEDGRPLHLTEPPQLMVERIRAGVYWVTDGVYQNMFYVADEGVVLVNAPPSLLEATPSLIDGIKSVTDLPVAYLLLSHTHKDHIGGARAIIKEWPDVTVFTSEVNKELLKEAKERDPEDTRPIPSLTFDRLATISPALNVLLDADASPQTSAYSTDALGDYGNGTFEGIVITSAAFRTESDLFVYAPTRRTLMVVELVQPGWSPRSRFGGTKDVHAYLRAHDILLGFEFDNLISGHSNRLGDFEDAERQKEFVFDIKEAAEEAIEYVIENPPKPKTDACDDYNIFLESLAFEEAIVERCAETVLEKWEGVLGGVEMFIGENCDAMQAALRLE